MFIVAGCTRGSAPAEPTGPAPATDDEAPSCAAVMPKMTEAAWRLLERGGAGPDVIEPAREVAIEIEPQLVQACIDDAWSAELRRCIADTPVLDLERCVDLVTPEQQETVIRIRDAAEPDRAE